MSEENFNDQPTEQVIVDAKPVIDPNADKPEEYPVYHNKESWEAAKGAHEEAEESAKNAKPTDYVYEFNGFTVKAIEPTETQRAGTDGLLYEITSGDFLKVVMEKQDAITYVQTHAPYMPASKKDDATVPVD